MCIALAVVALAAATVSAAAPATHAIRVPAQAADALAAIGIQARHDLDYGSFRWLVVDDATLARIDAAGVPHTEVAGAGTVQVQGFRFDPIAGGEPAIPDALRSPEDRAGLHLLQLIGPVRDEWTAELAAAGVRLLQYYPHNSYLVWTDPATVAGVESLPFVRWQGAFHPAYKLNATLDGRTGTINNVDVMFYNDGRVDDVLEELAKFGAVVLQHFPSQPDEAFYNAILSVTASHLEDIARMPHVLWLGYQSPEPILDDEMSDQIVAGNHPGGIPVTGYQAHLATLGFDGSGVIWAPIDTGVDYDHPDLGPSIVGGYSYPGACDPPGQPGSDCSGGGHGTHVAGIIGGTAVAGYTDAGGFLYGLGVAPNYSIFTTNSLSASAWPPSGGWQEHSKRAVLGNAIGGNNSWTTGEGTQHGYQASERTHDLMVRDGNFDTASVAEPFIEVFSAGNSGTSGLTAPKEAKNLIVTASSRNYRAGNIDSISSFSSRGPAVDGRWVPTIAAPGETIASARNDLGGSCSTSISGTNNLYAFCSGTSMAAPHTSGVITVAAEWWRSFNAGADPSPAMAKALVVNSAVDMATPDIPNINEGWGRVNVTNLVNPGVTREYWDQTDLFADTGQQIVIAVGIPDPTQPLKVTLAWSDAPGAVGANPALVNNLDLTVETGGDNYRGNVFSAGWSATGGSFDTINNLENVYVQNPGGSAVITINATAIVGDGVPYNGDPTDQDFALVCTNCALQPDFTLDVAPDVLTVCAPSPGLYDVSVGSILGFDDPVTLDATGAPAGSSVLFSVNPVIPTGSSVLTIGSTGSAAPGSYSIEVSGTSTTGVKSRSVALDLFDASPGAVALVSPANGALNQPTLPVFEWTAAAQAGAYRLQVATDSGFNNLVLDEDAIADTTFTPDTDLATSTEYYWRVRAENACGAGGWSAVWSFVTESQPGDCGPGTLALTHFADDFESGAPGWTHSGSGDSWSLHPGITGAHSGAFVFHANDTGSTTDQRLVSPPIVLPVDGFPITLQYWTYQSIEDSTSGCWDAGVLEISTDGGASWTYLQGTVMMTDPYDGTVNTSSNPLSGLQGWCGDPDPWIESVVDLDAYAGQTAQFRFRLGTDSSVGHDGWDIDDVAVQSCIPAAPDFTLGASPNTIAICAGSPAAYTVDVGAISGFANDVTLSASGHPAGSTASFSPNPVTPPGSSTLTIGNTAGAAGGSYVVTVSGAATGSSGHDVDVVLDVVAAAPAAPSLTAPSNGSTDQPLRPTFEWAAVAGADSYTLEVDDDPAFGSPEISETGLAGTSFTPAFDLAAGTTYWWRVAGENLCGGGASSAIYSFTTLSLMPFDDGFESGDTSAWSATVP
jgi:hypothetical protein